MFIKLMRERNFVTWIMPKYDIKIWLIMTYINHKFWPKCKDNNMPSLIQSDEPEPIKTLSEYRTLVPETWANILKLCDRLSVAPKALERYPECQRCYVMFALGSHPEYRVRGLATNMVKHAFQVFEQDFMKGYSKNWLNWFQMTEI